MSELEGTRMHIILRYYKQVYSSKIIGSGDKDGK